MSIFKGIPADEAYTTIGAAAAAIARAAEAQGFGASAWSLAELRPDQEDYAWLCDWMSHLSSGVAARCLGGLWRKFTQDELTFSYSAGIGALLLMSAVEVARRQATLGSLWTAVGRGPFPETTRAQLFVQSYRFSSAVSRSASNEPYLSPFILQGYPTRVYKDAVEQAARWLHLRHVFGIEGVQNWYDTVYLQFGFSRPGFVEAAPRMARRAGADPVDSAAPLRADAQRELLCPLGGAALFPLQQLDGGTAPREARQESLGPAGVG